MHFLKILNTTINSSYQSEMLLQREKQIVALEISSWLLVLVVEDFGVSPNFVLCCCQFTASYIFSRITCFAWTGGPGTIVPPYLREQPGGTSPHRRILIQAVNATHCWLISHTGLYLGCYCLILFFLFFLNGSPYI